MPVSVDYILDALSSLGGRAHLDDIVQRVAEIAPAPLPRSMDAIVRARIQERCAETESYKGKDDLFYSVYGVKARKGWWGLKAADPLNVGNSDVLVDGADAFIEAEEGKAALRVHLRRERSAKLVREFKASLSSITCAVCDFDFEAAYGELGRGYIEAHHKVPIALLKEGERTRLDDLIPLCANCHRMVHRLKSINWIELKGLVGQLRGSPPSSRSEKEVVVRAAGIEPA